MAESENRLLELYDRYIADTATRQELQEFWLLVQAMPDDHPIHGKVYELYERVETDGKLQTDWNGALQKIFDADKTISAPVHRIHLLKTAWIRYAAAVLIIAGVGAYLWNIKKDDDRESTIVNSLPVQNDVPPGGNRATLTLADGRTVDLDSAANGSLVIDNGREIAKTENSIDYSGLPASDEASADKSIVDSRLLPTDSPSPVIPSEARNLVFNKLTTPRGGQYQLTLPDGTKVWLNAASSITYPTAFAGNERRVSITGEAYFEVAKSKTKKFVVNVDGKQEVEVLGTQFNINAYKDENAIKTTLIEGSVRLSIVHSPLPTDHSPFTLKPGQQAILDSRLLIVESPDLDQVLAWKNGVFNFNKSSLPEVMRQLSRWYDVQVIYENEIPEMKFGGKMGRDLKLSQVLKALSAMGVKFRIEGRKLIVT